MYSILHNINSWMLCITIYSVSLYGFFQLDQGDYNSGFLYYYSDGLNTVPVSLFTDRRSVFYS